ncbi:hypothetical protein Landi51_02095 [Colletotrichum acutatum]
MRFSVLALLPFLATAVIAQQKGDKVLEGHPQPSYHMQAWLWQREPVLILSHSITALKAELIVNLVMVNWAYVSGVGYVQLLLVLLEVVNSPLYILASKGLKLVEVVDDIAE